MEDIKNVHAGHRQRMKEMFLKNGFEGFSEHQIMEMLLFYTYPRIDTNEIAHNLINRFGGICGVFDASIEDLVNIGGVSLNSAVLIKMIPLSMRAYNMSKTEHCVFDNTDKLCELFKGCFPGDSKECFYVAAFDDDLRLVRNSLVCKGGPSSAPVDLRKLAEIVLQSGASLVAVAHNHPKGSCQPSDTDIMTTRRIAAFLSSFGVRLLDHVVVGRDGVVSMRKSGMLSGI
ncbi:MAG: RadC family protein [Oscillospiraceae bacterium]